MNRKYEDRDHCSLLYFYTVHTVLFQSRTTLFPSYCFITFSVIHYLGLVDFNELETLKQCCCKNVSAFHTSTILFFLRYLS